MAQHAAEMRCDQPIREDEEDEGWVPAGGREPADYSGDEDDQEEPAVPAFTASDATSSGDKNRVGVMLQLKTPNDEGEESDEYEVVRVALLTRGGCGLTCVVHRRKMKMKRWIAIRTMIQGRRVKR